MRRASAWRAAGSATIRTPISSTWTSGRSASGAGSEPNPPRENLMAKDGGGGGSALGWTLLGFLAGIAATLGVQILLGPKSAPEREVAPAPAAVHVVVSSAAPAPA